MKINKRVRKIIIKNYNSQETLSTTASRFIDKFCVLKLIANNISFKNCANNINGVKINQHTNCN